MNQANRAKSKDIKNTILICKITQFETMQGFFLPLAELTSLLNEKKHVLFNWQLYSKENGEFVYKLDAKSNKKRDIFDLKEQSAAKYPDIEFRTMATSYPWNFNFENVGYTSDIEENLKILIGQICKNDDLDAIVIDNFVFFVDVSAEQDPKNARLLRKFQKYVTKSDNVMPLEQFRPQDLGFSN